MSVRLYFKPANSRAYILIATKDRYGRERQYTEPLTELKVIRNASILQLCKAGRGSSFECWAKLNFYTCERAPPPPCPLATQYLTDLAPGMILFYCTFTAMKRQDRRDVPHEDLLDDHELSGPERFETLLFAGQIKDDDMVHALRIWRDRTSGVFRLEACALRGPMKDVPLWTAFVTRYAVDPDHVQRESGRVVSLAALRPAPYVFLSGYTPVRNEIGEYIFQFASTDGESRSSKVCRKITGWCLLTVW